MPKILGWRSADNDNFPSENPPHNYAITVSVSKKGLGKKLRAAKLQISEPQADDVVCRQPVSGRGGVLYRYADAGWLDMGDKRYTAEDRIRVAERLHRDFRLSQFSDCKAVELGKITPEICGDFTLLDNVLDARTRYQQAMMSIPHEFWLSVRRVCIEDKELFDNDNGESKRQQAYRTYAAKVDLCRGLDRLIEHYLRRKKEKNKAV